MPCPLRKTDMRTPGKTPLVLTKLSKVFCCRCMPSDSSSCCFLTTSSAFVAPREISSTIDSTETWQDQDSSVFLRSDAPLQLPFLVFSWLLEVRDNATPGRIHPQRRSYYDQLRRNARKREGNKMDIFAPKGTKHEKFCPGFSNSPAGSNSRYATVNAQGEVS